MFDATLATWFRDASQTGNIYLGRSMDICQGTLPDQPVWESNRTDIHYAGGDRLHNPPLSIGISISPLVFLDHLSSSIECQFCAAFELYCAVFAVFAGESIRCEHASHIQMFIFGIDERSFGYHARLCNPGIQTQIYNVGIYTICSLRSNHPCGITLLVEGCRT